MKIWILNNTKIDKYKDWENYFNTIFIPLLDKYSKDDDIVLHLGNIFNNSDFVSIKILNKLIDIFSKIAEKRAFYFLDGYDTELLKTIKRIDNTTIIDEPLSIDNIKFIPKKYNIIEHIDNDIVFINSQIEQSLLKNYKQKFYCGYYDLMMKNDNIINVGTPYQLNENSSSGIYVVDSKSLKQKYLPNKKSIIYKTIRITNLSQIDDLDSEFINNNNVSIEIDKSLIDDKKLKIDVLLNKYNFKAVSYINETDDDIELIDNSSLKMEDLLIEKIKNSDNKLLLSEFENIMKIYKERY